MPTHEGAIRAGWFSTLRQAIGLAFVLLLVAPLFLSQTATAEASGEDQAWLRGQLSASAWLASLTGELQTPAGGLLGTTSSHRPTTAEIGLDGLRALAIVDAGLRLFDHHELHFAMSWIAADGSAVLDEDLISQDVRFLAGSLVQSELELPIFRLGYRAHWLGLEHAGWSVVPEVGYAAAAFDYRLSSPSVGGRVSRGYSIGFPYLALLIAGPIHRRVSFEADIAGAAGIGGVFYCETDFRIIWRLLESSRVSPSLLAGLRGSYFQRNDDQEPEPNDIDLRAGSFSNSPWAGFHLGLRLDF